MEKLIEQEQEKPTKTRADKRTRRKNSFFSDAVDKLHKKDSSYRNISYFRFLLTLLSVIIGALALRSFIVEPTIVDGESMQTTLMDGERVLVEKVSYWFNEPQRGDIVIVRFPNASLSASLPSAAKQSKYATALFTSTAKCLTKPNMPASGTAKSVRVCAFVPSAALTAYTPCPRAVFL